MEVCVRNNNERDWENTRVIASEKRLKERKRELYKKSKLMLTP